MYLPESVNESLIITGGNKLTLAQGLLPYIIIYICTDKVSALTSITNNAVRIPNNKV